MTAQDIGLLAAHIRVRLHEDIPFRDKVIASKEPYRAMVVWSNFDYPEDGSPEWGRLIALLELIVGRQPVWIRYGDGATAIYQVVFDGPNGNPFESNPCFSTEEKAREFAESTLKNHMHESGETLHEWQGEFLHTTSEDDPDDPAYRWAEIHLVHID